MKFDLITISELIFYLSAIGLAFTKKDIFGLCMICGMGLFFLGLTPLHMEEKDGD